MIRHTSRRALVAGALLFGPFGWLIGQGAVQAQAGPSGVLARVKTEYNDIIVRRRGQLVYMEFVVGRCEFSESAYAPGFPDFLPFPYTRSITAALAYPANTESLLEIGVGGGRTISYLRHHMPELAITGVEIDPGVIALAKEHFGLVEDEQLKIAIEDGRKFLAEATTRYDLIMVDAYRGAWVPETLTTVEFFTLAKARLNPGGAIAQNVEPDTLFYDGIAATLKAVFDQVDAIESEPGGNTVLIAYDGAPKSQAALLRRAEALQGRYAFRHPINQLLAVRAPAVIAEGVEPLRDGFARANTLLNIDKANSADTPRQRTQACQ